jgi:hypothetical protein
LDPAAEYLAPHAGPRHFDMYDLRSSLAKAADQLIERAGVEYPPVRMQDLEQMAALQGIKAISTMEINNEGLLFPVEDGFLAQLDKSQYHIRLRTSLAHEIGHTFFYERSAARPRVGFQRSKARRQVEEGLAWEIARGLLLPSKILKPMLRADTSWPPSIRSFVDLKDAFCVSHDLLARRLQDLATLDPQYAWNGVIYSLDSTVKNNPITAWKFGRFGNSTAYSKAMSKNKKLLETAIGLRSGGMREAQILVSRGQFGSIPPGKYVIGSTQVGSRQLMILVNSSARGLPNQ